MREEKNGGDGGWIELRLFEVRVSGYDFSRQDEIQNKTSQVRGNRHFNHFCQWLEGARLGFSCEMALVH